MHRIATIINYCSNESKFLGACIEQARKFSQQICIPVADHFFNGKPENLSSLKKSYAEFSDCTFVQFPFLRKELPKKWIEEIGHPRIWHNIARYMALQHIRPEIEYVLFLDVDEVLDAEKFSEWIDTNEYRKYHVMKLANYWYFRDTCFQAKTFEDSILLTKKRSITRNLILHKDERDALFDHVPGLRKRGILGLDGKPMGHHYSWVRSESEMLKKTESWGHSHDRDWKACIEQEFAKEFQGKDFVHGYEFEKVEPFIQLGSSQSLSESGPTIEVSREEFTKALGISNFFLSRLLKKIRFSS